MNLSSNITENSGNDTLDALIRPTPGLYQEIEERQVYSANSHSMTAVQLAQEALFPVVFAYQISDCASELRDIRSHKKRPVSGAFLNNVSQTVCLLTTF